MTRINPGNERIKRRYTDYLKEARGLSDQTIKQALGAIAAFEAFANGADFKSARDGDAKAFRKHLLDNGGREAAARSNRATVNGIVIKLRGFFAWLAREPGMRKALSGFNPDFFNLSMRDVRIANTRCEKPSPTLADIQLTIRKMPADTDIQKRDRAVVALILLTGIRVKALTTLKLKHVRADRRGIDQDARDVETKLGKSFPSFFFPVGEDIEQAFLDYVDFLEAKLGFGPDDPLFPSTRQGVCGKGVIEVIGLTRMHWKTTDMVRLIFKRAFDATGVPNQGPHAIRRTLALLGQQLCRTPEQLKAWSQNFGHQRVLTTISAYGAVSAARQAEIIRLVTTEKERGRLNESEAQLLRNLLDRMID